MPGGMAIKLIIFLLTAGAGFAGGAIIWARGLGAPGRTLAGMCLSLALWQTGVLAFLQWQAPWAIRACWLAELATVAGTLFFLCSLEGRLARQKILVRWIKIIVTSIVLLAGLLLILTPNLYLRPSPRGLIVEPLGLMHALAVLAGIIGGLWIMENILRSAGDEQRRAILYPLLGIMAIGIALLIDVIYRIGNRTISLDTLVLTSLLMLIGISLTVFFSIRQRLFTLDIFVSRYVVYHSFTFLGIGIYLVVGGLVIFGMQRLGLNPSFVAVGFLGFCAALILAILILSPKLRARVRFFIDTHFFAHKYDYRKEWGELSRDLCSATTAKQIVDVTAQVILDSMFLQELSIWLLEEHTFTCAFAFPRAPVVATVARDHPLIDYLSARPFLRAMPVVLEDRLWERVVSADNTFLELNRIELAVPIKNEADVIGFIAMGRQYPGTPYGADDIDLLSNIATQCGASLLQARYAQQLAENKEIDAYNYLSASLLHDLKNAAGHLSLILQNAPRHIDQKAFQQDMLDTIGQALARIDKVTGKLGRLAAKEAVTPGLVQIAPFVEALLERLKPRLSALKLTQHIPDGLAITTDPHLLERMLENLVVNASEACDDHGEILISAGRSPDTIWISVADDGPGMAPEFVRTRIFKPFQTTKPTGTGLGLWQVKHMAQQIGARITAQNRLPQGAVFTLIFAADKTAASGADQ